MSYEGYIQFLCPKGHLTVVDAFDHPERCSRCNELFIWSHSVDLTNGEIPGLPATQPFPLIPRTYRTIQIPDTYHIPLDHPPKKR